MCRQSSWNVHPVVNRTILNRLGSLLVLCPLCAARVERSELANHAAKACPEKIIECPRCSASVPRGQVDKEHVQYCPVPCANGCGVRVAPSTRDAHRTVCTFIARPCVQGCGVDVRPVDQAAHNSTSCALSMVKCPASDVLCPWEDARRLFPEHVSSCPFIRLHPVLHNLINRVDKLERELVHERHLRGETSDTGANTPALTDEKLTEEALDAIDEKNLAVARDRLVAALAINPFFVPALLLHRAVHRSSPLVFKSDDIGVDDALRLAREAPAEKRGQGKKFVERLAGPPCKSGSRLFLSGYLKDLIEGEYAEAVKWYRMAADLGNAIAQYSLGVCFEDGQGVSMNHDEAAKWYHMAAEKGHAGARAALERFGKCLLM